MEIYTRTRTDLIWLILRVFRHKLDILEYIELYIADNLWFDSKNQIVLVLSKIIHIWPKMTVTRMPIFCIRFLAIWITQRPFWTKWAEFFMGDYYLSISDEKPKYLCLRFFNFLGHFWLENGCGHLMVFGLQTRPKIWPTGWTFSPPS